jgi:hypothetical protein
MQDEPEETDLNVLMSLDPLELSRRDLDQIIAYQRKNRAQREAGVRTRKPKADGPKIDIKDLLASVPKATPSGPTIRRRV